MIWYRWIGKHEWHDAPLDVPLPEFALEKLEPLGGRDSDNGYHEAIEFYDGLLGHRTYAVAAFAGYFEDDGSGGHLEEFGYGSFAEVTKQFGMRVDAYPYTPDRDWIIVGGKRWT